ncbi:MAG: hypothetical protein ACREOG_08440, partial [Gemmatimonadaceae bacterium]
AQRAVAATNAHTAAMTDTAAARAATSPSAAATPGSKRAAPGARVTDPTGAPNADTTRSRVTTSKGATVTKPERNTFEREIFSYNRSGRRDPFVSLMTTGDIRPLLPDLRLVGIAYDASGRNSVAVLREDAQEQTNKKAANQSMADVPMYRVKEGQQLGRMRVARIGQKSITFTIEEFGYSRQETLTLSESNTEKKP